MRALAAVVVACGLALGGLFSLPLQAARNKVSICHKPGTRAERTMMISAAARDGHLEHGDTIGECGVEPPGGGDGTDRIAPEELKALMRFVRQRDSRRPGPPATTLEAPTMQDPADDVPISPTAPARILREEIASVETLIARMIVPAPGVPLVHLPRSLDHLRAALESLTAPPDRHAMVGHLGVAIEALQSAISSAEAEGGGIALPEVEHFEVSEIELIGDLGRDVAESAIERARVQGVDPALIARAEVSLASGVEEMGGVRGSAARGEPRLRHRPLRAGDQWESAVGGARLP